MGIGSAVLAVVLVLVSAVVVVLGSVGMAEVGMAEVGGGAAWSVDSACTAVTPGVAAVERVELVAEAHPAVATSTAATTSGRVTTIARCHSPLTSASRSHHCWALACPP